MKATGKTIRIAIAMIAVIATTALSPPVYAQGRKGQAAPPTPEEAMKQKQRSEEAQAAKAAMDRIPDSKEKYNPWKIER